MSRTINNTYYNISYEVSQESDCRLDFVSRYTTTLSEVIERFEKMPLEDDEAMEIDMFIHTVAHENMDI